MCIKLKRKLKTLFPNRQEKLVDSLFKKSLATAIAILILFLTTQLLMNSILTPQGAKLEQLNSEKNTLIEDNRQIAQEVARIRSISIIKEITESEMDLRSSSENSIVYISNESVIAGL